LAATGADTSALVTLGLGLLAAGSVTMLSARRRARTERQI
jgi:LPXTG-motif cell wall-anchored protein